MGRKNRTLNIDWSDPVARRDYYRSWKTQNHDYRKRYNRDYMQKRRQNDLAQRIGCGRADRGWTSVPMEIRRALIIRAEGRCELKDVSCRGPLGCHHINGDHNDHRLENLLLLCKKHHNVGEHKIQIQGGFARAKTRYKKS